MRARSKAIAFACLVGIGLPLAMFQSVKFSETRGFQCNAHDHGCDQGDRCGRSRSFWLTRLNEALIPPQVSAVSCAGTCDQLRALEAGGKLAYFDAVLKHDPNDWQLYTYRAIAHCNTGDYEKALPDHTRSIELAPELGYLWSNRGYTKAHIGDFKGAMADCNTAIRLDPSFSYAFNNRGYARYHLGDKVGAIADFKQALRLDPYNPHAPVNLDDAQHDRQLRKWRD